MRYFRTIFLIALPLLFRGADGLCAESGGKGGSSCQGLYASLKTNYQLYRGKLLEKADPELYQVFEKIRQDPAYALNEADLRYLNEKGYLGLTEQWRGSNALVKRLNKEIADVYRSQVHAGNESFIVRFLKGCGKVTFPMYKMFQRESGTDKIAKLILENPEYKLSAEQIAYLTSKRTLQDMIRFQADVQSGLAAKFARINQVRQIGKTLTWGVAVSGTTMGLVGNKYVSTKESFDENSDDGMSRYDDKVELIFLSPMPHVSIRMGGTVYNYGVLNVERWDLDQFKKTVGFGEKVSGNHTRIELKLTDEQKEKLRDYLEDDVGKVYPLAIPFVDCVSQTNKAVKFATGIAVPPVANRSQSLSIAWYKLHRLLGDETVGDVRFASGGNPVVDKGKDAVINTLDGMMFMKYGPTLLMTSPVIDHFKMTLDPLTGEWK